MEAIVETYGTGGLIAIALIAFMTSAIHGATGVAGGFLLSAAIAPFIGVAPIVPVISISLLISHSARAILNIRDFDPQSFYLVSVPAIPCIIAMAFMYGQLSSSLIAIILGCIILLSIPIRRWTKNRQIKTSKAALSGVGAIYGALSGISIGPGMLLLPFMLSFGLLKEQLVATLAVIALLTNITRVSVFGATDLLGSEYVMIGLLCGLCTIPGNWLGRTFLRKMSSQRYAGLVDILTVLGALNFFWLSTQ